MHYPTEFSEEITRKIANLEAIKDADFELFTWKDETLNFPSNRKKIIKLGRNKVTGDVGITLHQQNIVRSSIGMELSPTSYVSLGVGKVITANSIYSFSALMRITDCLAVPPTIKLLLGSKLNLNNIMSILLWIPGMTPAVQGYCQFPDDGIAKGDEDESLAYCKTLYSGFQLGFKMNPAHAIRTQAEMKAIGYAILLSFTKSTKNEANFMAFLTKRITAFKFTLGMEGSEIDIAKLFNMVSTAELMGLSEQIAFYPQLMKTVFQAVIMVPTPELGHMREIFKETSLTTFSFIANFLQTEEPTYLHLHSSVIRDTLKWGDSFAKLHAEYGNDWEFYKLLEPRGTLTSVKNLKHLACAAYSWMIVTTNQASLDQLQGVASNDMYKSMARKKLPVEVLSKAGQGWGELVGLLKASRIPLNIKWEALEELVADGTIKLDE